jgi:TPR repeat protein
VWTARVGLRALDEIARAGPDDRFLEHARARAREGNSDWQFMLGYLALHREDPSLQEARQWLERAAAAGHADAIYALAIAGVSDRTGHLRFAVPASPEGWATVRCAAEAGSLDAQRMLACALAGGEEGLQQDPVAARAWHERAAERGVRLSQYDAGMMWLDGEGGPIGTEKGLRWLELAANGPAADLGTLWARTALANLYETGHLGVPRNGRAANHYRGEAAVATEAFEDGKRRERDRAPPLACTRLIGRWAGRAGRAG